jgi:proline iminopeptidase
VAEYGRPDGVPVLVLHGGPGSGGSPRLAGLFDPARFRVIVPDQRGAGRSEPVGATAANTTADLLADIDVIRAALGSGAVSWPAARGAPRWASCMPPGGRRR